jgi:hypothetical protein
MSSAYSVRDWPLDADVRILDFVVGYGDAEPKDREKIVVPAVQAANIGREAKRGDY